MKLYPDCDYFGDQRDSKYAPEDGNCEGCYRWEICIKAFMKDRQPILINLLHNYIGRKVWIQSPRVPEYGRVAIVEDVEIEKAILYLKDDYTCHQYGTIWEAYDLGRVLNGNNS